MEAERGQNILTRGSMTQTDGVLKVGTLSRFFFKREMPNIPFVEVAGGIDEGAGERSP